MRQPFAEHPFADSGEWPATTSALGLDVHATDPDSWVQPPPPEPAPWFETASDWSPRSAPAEPDAPDMSRVPPWTGEAIMVTVLGVIAVWLLAAGLRLQGIL